MGKEVYDIIIIGGGPAGFTAGIYAARARMNTLLIESFSVMGQATMTEVIENYPGIERIGGFDFVSALKKQAEAFGLKTSQGTVKRISQPEEKGAPVWLVEDDNGTHEALSVIVASGARPKKLQVPGEKELLGKGVSYCAVCDAAFFRDKEVIAVGGGDTAVEEALYLARFAKKVKIVHRRDSLRAAKVLQERVFASKKMEFVWDSTVESINGADKVEKIIVKNVKTGEKKDIPCDGVFVFIGWHPNTDFIKDVVNENIKGGIMVDKEMRTSQEGVFACGDCCHKVLHQVVTACGDGAVAAFSAQQYVEELKGTAYR